MITLYKKDSKGKIRILILKTEKDTLIQQAGLVTGKLVVNTRQCSPKNVGRANATTGEEQAIVEAKAIKVKKLKEGYFNTIDEVIASNILMPMLAKVLDTATISYPIYTQKKFDGVRCLATNKEKLTRKNRVISTVSHIDLSKLPDDTILDGELLNINKTFQENISLIKKYREGKTETIKYYVYDLPSHPGVFLERYTALTKLLKRLRLPGVELVATTEVSTLKELLQLHKTNISQGFEGSIIRTNNTKYEFNKRSSSLLKLKDFIDEEFIILDIVPSEKRPEQGIVVCKTKEGQIFKATPAMSHEDRATLLKNKEEYIGKLATVEFFERTTKGLPRFPIFKSIRDYE